MITVRRNRATRLRPPSGGFTLLEVLVVVAIIALLVAVLLPGLSRARDQVRRVTCEANLKQIHLAWATYLDSNDGYFPAGMDVEYNYGGLQGGGSAFFGGDPTRPVRKPLNRHMNLPVVLREGGKVFRCPSDTGTFFVQPTAFWYYGTSYYPNNVLIGRCIWVPPSSPCKAAWDELVGDPWAWPPKAGMLDRFNRSRIDNPAQLILIGDYAWLDNWDDSVPDQFPFWHRTRSRHNIAFFDGHAEFVRIRKGIHVDPKYSLIPFKRIREKMLQTQQEIPCP